MKKYLKFTCTICKRSIDRLVDNVRVTPDGCTITLNCKGRLLPIRYQSNGAIASPPQVGLTDWFPRGNSTFTEVPTVPLSFLDTSTGLTQQLVIGIPLAVDPGPGATAQLQLQTRSDTPNAYRQYTYRFDTTFSNVAGIEAGVDKKTLRFNAYGTTPDLVQVYLNGVQVAPGATADYQIYDGTSGSSVPPNMISFNSPVALPGTTQVDVVVSQAVVLNTSLLTLARTIDNEARRATGAWENISAVEHFNGSGWVRYYTFYVDILNSAALTLNTILIPVGNVIVSGPIPISLNQIYVLLARPPFSKADRYVDVSVNLSVLTTEHDYFKYHAISGIPTLEITQTSLTATYPPGHLDKFQIEPTIKVALAGTINQPIVDGAVVIGPDE